MTKDDKYRKLTENFKKYLTEQTIITPDNITNYIDDIELEQDTADIHSMFPVSAILKYDNIERDATEEELDWIQNDDKYMSAAIEDHSFRKYS